MTGAPEPSAAADPRRGAFLRGLVRDAGGFTPEVTLADEGPALALASVVSRYAAILGESLARLPLRSRLAFADFCADAVQPAASARVPLVLSLLPGAAQDLVLPQGSRFAARLPPPPPTLDADAQAAYPDEAEFATDEQVTLTRGTLAACHSIDPSGDVYADHLARLLSQGDEGAAPEGATLFAGLVQAPHDLYIGHDLHLALKGQAEITVYIDFHGAAEVTTRRPILLDWSYLTEEGWFPLAVSGDTTRRLTRDGIVRLRKDCGPDAIAGEIDGRASFWLRASVSDRRPRGRGRPREPGEMPDPRTLLVEDSRDFLPGDEVTLDGIQRTTIANVGPGTITLDSALPIPPEGRVQAVLTLADALPPLRPEGTDTAGLLPQIDGLRFTVGFVKGGLLPDSLLLDGQVLDTNMPFAPLGEEPGPGTTLFVACAEAFARPAAQIRLRSELYQVGVPVGSTFSVTAEYWNGGAWIALSGADGLRGTEDVFTGDGIAAEPELRFDCPANWEKTEVGGDEQLWLRLRVLAGGFGQRVWQTVQDEAAGTISVQEAPGSLTPPIMTAISISYIYRTRRALPDHCVTYNDFLHSDRSFDVRWRRRPFAPFTPTADRAPAVHLGFTAKLPVGLVSLLVTVPGMGGPTPEPRPFVFEYRSARGWSELAVLDGTDGFTRTGLLQFVGPGDAVAAPGLGGTLWRIRARLKRGQRMQARPISGLWPNGVWATQSAAVRRTVLGRSDGTAGQLFLTPPATVPVLPGAELEVQEWTGRGADWTTAVAGAPPEDIRIELDPVDGATPVAVWVRWHVVRHFAGSGPDDRHLLLDPATGHVRSGGEGRGMVLPARATLAMTWRFGGMLAGNVAAGAVREVRSTAPGLAGVANPVAASGAAAEETVPRLLPRSAARFAHRFRAVRAEDYAWMAREATPELARAVARPVTGPEGRVQPGHVELVLIPQTLDPRPVPGQALRARVEAHLAAHMPAGISRGLRLVAPRYAGLSVVVRAELAGGERAGAVEARMRQALDTYLHALAGGPAAQGWEFGATLRLSHIAELLDGLQGVGGLTLLRWLQDGVLADETVVLGEDVLPAPGDHQIALALEAVA